MDFIIIAQRPWKVTSIDTAISSFQLINFSPSSYPVEPSFFKFLITTAAVTSSSIELYNLDKVIEWN